MDKRMPGIGGIEATRRMLERDPRLVVFLVSVENPTSTALEASGAAAFLDKRRLSTRALVELWEAHGALASRRAAPRPAACPRRAG